jgi:hypothetical protein
VLNFSLLFHLSFAAFLPNLEFCSSLTLDDHFELVFGLWSFSCASIGLEFEIQDFVHLELSMYSSRGRLRNQVVCVLVYMCDE